MVQIPHSARPAGLAIEMAFLPDAVGRMPFSLEDVIRSKEEHLLFSGFKKLPLLLETLCGNVVDA
jgi:hypothetical protein